MNTLKSGELALLPHYPLLIGAFVVVAILILGFCMGEKKYPRECFIGAGTLLALTASYTAVGYIM